MNTGKRFLITAIIVVIFSHALPQAIMAQEYDDVGEIVEEAMGYFEYNEYHGALPLLQKADSLNPGDPKISYYLGVCYVKMQEPDKAYSLLKTARKHDYDKEKLQYYWAVSLHSINKFDEAIREFKDYKEKLLNQAGTGEMVSRVNRYISWCNNARKLVKDSMDVTIENMGNTVNSEHPEYTPVISADETFLIFTSRRPNTTGGKIDLNDNFYYEDIYFTKRKPDSSWKEPQKFGHGINTPGHEACAGLSPDGQKMFIYKSRENSSHLAGDIYVSNLKGDEWSEPEKLGEHINSDKYEPSVSITPEEQVLFFSSNREGGYGGTDIYMSRRLPDNTWGKAINLGPQVNTKYDEDGPFIHPDGKTLYFSSEGHNTMGGYDIFKCEINTKNVDISDVENVGYPINTTGDDIFFTWSADGKRAYFSSKRKDGYGQTDLYVITTEEKEEKALVVLKGKILNCKKDEAVAATITVSDNATGELLGIYNSNSSTGKYIVILPAGKNYHVKINSSDFESYSEDINIPDLDHYKEINEDICLQSIGGSENQGLFSLKKTLENVDKNLHSVRKGEEIILDNVFFDFNKATLRKKSEKELDKLVNILKRHDNLKIKVVGHTDDVGSKSYNQKLSEDRAKAVVEYLINKGVEENKLKYSGKGESEPIASNETEKGRQLNRRTSFEVLAK